VYCAARLSMCRVVLQIPQARHTRLVADKSLASSYSILVRHARFPRDFLSDILARMSRGCYEKTASVEFQPYAAALASVRSGRWHPLQSVTGDARLLLMQRRNSDGCLCSVCRVLCAQLVGATSSAGFLHCKNYPYIHGYFVAVNCKKVRSISID